MTYFDNLADARKKMRENSLLALESQVELAEYLSRPSSIPAMQNFAKHYGNSGNRFTMDPLQRGAWIHDTVKRIAGTGATYYVTPDMCEMAKMAAEGMPSEGLSPTALPSERGFLFFAKPVFIDGPGVTEDESIQIPIAAVLWESGMVKSADGEVRPGVSYYLYATNHDMAVHLNKGVVRLMEQESGVPMPEPIMEVYEQEGRFWSAQEIRADEGPMSLYDFSGWNYGVPWNSVPYTDPTGIGDREGNEWGGVSGTEGEDGSQRVHPIVDQVRRHLLATWLLFGQTVTKLQSETPPRYLRRRADRFMPENGDIVIVRLRKEITVGPKDKPEDYEPDEEPWYTHRFLVKGHWKRQHYGPGNTETKLLWISPYVKGDESLPLILKDRVYSLEA
jgi:hypothetical protein